MAECASAPLRELRCQTIAVCIKPPEHLNHVKPHIVAPPHWHIHCIRFEFHQTAASQLPDKVPMSIPNVAACGANTLKPC
eukprot:13201079-Alexandrium_andersonii.AAC.1